MKKLHIVLLVIVFAAAAVVFTGPPVGLVGHGTSVRADVTPSSAPEALPVWAAPPAQTEPAAETAPPQETPAPEPELENLMFLGESLLANPEKLEGTFSGHGHQVLAGNGATIPEFFGISERTLTVGVSEFGTMTGSLAGRDFNGIVILLGANDIAFESPSRVMDDYRTLLEELTEHFNTVPVFVLKVYPAGTAYASHYAGSAEDRNRNTAELNGLLEAYCEETDGVWFADATASFTDAAGYLLHDGGDGLHISQTYYEEFYEEIEQAICCVFF